VQGRLVARLAGVLCGARVAAGHTADQVSPVKHRRWAVASFEHHSGTARPAAHHIHNIIATSLTIGSV